MTAIQERYLSATQSSNLRCETGEDAPIGDVAILIAAGWSASRIGQALMRLHTSPDRHTIGQVHAQLVMQAELWGIEQPVIVATGVLGWWLSKTCTSCNGVKFELIPGTPALSTRLCLTCNGSGDKQLPFGESGKRVARMIDECIERGRASIKKRLYNLR